MSEIIVCARKADEKSYPVQKYDNNESWNRQDAFAPSGVIATRYLRRTNPDVDKLDILAKWLVENVPSTVEGNMPAHFLEHRVRCYNGKTEADMIRKSGKPNAENIIQAYDLEKKWSYISDWLFPIIGPDEIDIDYWNRTAKEMIDAGTIKIQIGDNIFEV